MSDTETPDDQLRRQQDMMGRLPDGRIPIVLPENPGPRVIVPQVARKTACPSAHLDRLRALAKGYVDSSLRSEDREAIAWAIDYIEMGLQVGKLLRLTSGGGL